MKTKSGSFLSFYKRFTYIQIKISMNSFTAEIGSRGYHVYRDTTWTNIALHQQVKVLKETNMLSKEIDPYCCKITIRWVNRIGEITVGHIPRELSRFVFYFIHEGGSVSGTVASLTPRISPIPEGGLEIPILMHFAHGNKNILVKMKSFVSAQVEKINETLNVKEILGEEEELNKEIFPEEIQMLPDGDEETENSETYRTEEESTSNEITEKNDDIDNEVIIID